MDKPKAMITKSNFFTYRIGGMTFEEQIKYLDKEYDNVIMNGNLEMILDALEFAKYIIDKLQEEK